MAGRVDSRLPTPPLPDPDRAWALFVDVDGTLLEFAPTPDAVCVSPSLIDLLETLHDRLHGALALVSGRAIAALDHLFQPLQLPCAGLHGSERRDAQGLVTRVDVSAGEVASLRRITDRVTAAFDDVLVEDKTFAVAFHYQRALRCEAALRQLLADCAADLGFELQAGRYVFELKPAEVNKGRALADFLGEPPFADRTPVFLGDDFTDMHALEEARRRRGMAIQVGDRIQGAGEFELPDPAAVRRWLGRWKEQLA